MKKSKKTQVAYISWPAKIYIQYDVFQPCNFIYVNQQQKMKGPHVAHIAFKFSIKENVCAYILWK